MNIYLIESIPLWGIFLVSILLSLLSFEIGFAIGGIRQKLDILVQETIGLWVIVAATLGLMVLILSFTFSMAASLFDDRREIILNESNAIGTTYLRAGVLPEPYRSNIQQLMRDYVSLMLDGIKTDTYDQLIKRYETLQDRLWAQAETIAIKQPDSVAVGLFIQSLNEIINLHIKRVAKGGRTLIPEMVWFAIFFIAFLAFLATGYLFGILGNGNILLSTILMITFSTIILLTADLDRPQEGVFQVNKQTLIDIYEQMNAPEVATE